jgi:hypothetical protein
MKQYAELKEKLRQLVGVSSLPVFNAKVLEVNGNVCTVEYKDLKLENVRLQATTQNSNSYLRLTPKKNSMVMVMGIDALDPLDDLVLIKVDEVEKIEFIQPNLKFELDASTGKLEVSNGTTSLLEIMEKLTNLLNSFSVLCPTPAGLVPSEGIDPATMISLNLFQNTFKTLLK